MRLITDRLVAMTAAAAVVSAGFVFPLNGQQPVQVDLSSKLNCPTCSVEIRRVVRLGSANGPGKFSGNVRAVVRDGSGRYFVIAGNPGSTGSPFVFDSTGKFLRMLGGRGSGRGDYEAPLSLFVLPGDSLMVIDKSRYQVHGPDLRYVRGAPMQQGFWDVAQKVTRLRSGDIVSSTASYTAAGIGFPLHRMTRGGQVTSFGRESQTSRSGIPAAFRYIVGPGLNDNVWVATQNPFEATLLSGQGDTRRALAFIADWLPTAPPPVKPDRRTTPPYPGVYHVREDAGGRLWIAFAVPGARWSEAWGEPIRTGNSVGYYEPRWDYLYATMIAVVDWKAGKVLATRKFEGFTTLFFQDDMFAEYLQDEEGTHVVDIWRMSLVVPPSR